MRYSFEILRITRNNILKSIENLTLEQLNHIPTGFNNNIIWNVIHLVATQQLLVYGLSGVPFAVAKELVDAYKKGTAPSTPLSAEQVMAYKSLLISTIDQMEQDYENGVFGNGYQTYTTSFNITLKKVEDAIEFNNVHEAMHYGAIKSLMNLV
jgi:hypothetical protein